ncbi:AAA domain-containing protein, partial [candidate division KSB3 bacterium]|nr:AAA domain-containing protein [candidate division KSB3 bacterium]MBD3327155.1 AAA domain-containing protein [candidate division KSB3 bacterium]
MSRHRIDTKTKPYAYDENLPESRCIEDPQVEPVPETDPKTKTVDREPYLPGDRIIEAVNLAIALGRPLLLQGDPGCGKTRLAYAAAYTLEEGLPLEECYIKSTSRAQDLLYTYDAVNRLYDSQLGAEGPKDEEGNPKSQSVENYIHLGPLGRAIVRAQHGRRSVVLIDEIDKADIDFPNDLLLEFDRLEFQVAEAPSMKYTVPADRPELRPIVFVTHNEEKALPTAFLRRCIFHYVEFPSDEEHLRRILSLHDVTDEDLSRKAIEVLLRLRQMDLSKNPGLSELIDWVSYMQAVKTPVKEVGKLPYI